MTTNHCPICHAAGPDGGEGAPWYVASPIDDADRSNFWRPYMLLSWSILAAQRKIKVKRKWKASR